MPKHLSWAALGLFLLFSGPAQADELKIGDPAPKLEVKEFLKGQPVAKFDKGTVYVVEFWATWCGPCRVSIPHLTELQKQYKGKVVVIGVSVWENDPKAVKPFVEEMGDKMDYRVAVDDLAEAAKAESGKMARNWMEAAGQEGIPTSFIVNGEGKIAWIGHPMQMDKSLGEIVAGKYDLAAAAKKYGQDLALKKKMNELRIKLAEAQRSGDMKKVLLVIDQAIEGDEALERQLGFGKFRLLLGPIDDSAKAMAYGNRLVDKVFSDDSNMLNNLAWMIVDPDAAQKPDGPMVKLALKAALRADQLAQGKEPHIADTLAKAYFDAGDVKKALETQERALKLAKGTEFEKDDSMKERLEQYRKAAQKK